MNWKNAYKKMNPQQLKSGKKRKTTALSSADTASTDIIDLEAKTTALSAEVEALNKLVGHLKLHVEELTQKLKLRRSKKKEIVPRIDRRKRLTWEEKKIILQKMDCYQARGKTWGWIAGKLNVPESSLRRIRERKWQIIQETEASGHEHKGGRGVRVPGRGRKRVTAAPKGKYHSKEVHLYHGYFLPQRRNGHRITSRMLRYKMMQFTQEENPNFKASTGWLRGFLRRFILI